MFCRQCGNRLELGSLFCAGCGAKATTPVSGPDPTRENGNYIFTAQAKGFFESLFDFSFTSLVTTKLIKVLYGLSMVVLALVSVWFVAISFVHASPQAGVLTLLFGAPLFFLFGVCFMRLISEYLIVVFRIAEHTAEIAQHVRPKEEPAEIKSSSQ